MTWKVGVLSVTSDQQMEDFPKAGAAFPKEHSDLLCFVFIPLLDFLLDTSHLMPR